MTFGAWLAVQPSASAFQAAPAATLSVSSAGAMPGGSVALSVSLSTANGAHVSGVQWTISYPGSSVSAMTALPGSSASAAGKTVQCVAGANPGTQNCIVFGLNQTAIPAGPVAVLTFQLAASAPAGSIPVGISGVALSDPAGMPIQVAPPPTGGTITIASSAVSQLNTLNCHPATVTSPGSTLCTAALTGPAPAGGVIVALSSANPNVTVPASVTVGAGSTNVSFTVSVAAVTSYQTALLTASIAGVSRTFTLTVAVPGQITQLEVFPPQVDFYLQPGVPVLNQSLHVAAANASAVNVNVSPASSGWLSASPLVITTPGQAALAVSNTPAGRVSGMISLVPISQGVPGVDVPVNVHSAGSTMYYIPRVVDGGGFATTITVSNLDSGPASVSLRFRRALPDTTTEPWTPLMENGQTTENVEIPVGGSFTWRTLGVGGQADAGWAQVICNRKIGGMAVYRQSVTGRADQEAAVPVVSTWQQRILLPFDNTGDLVTSMAITNAGETEMGEVRAIFRDSNGQLIPGSYRKVLPPQGHVAFPLASELPILGNRRGTAEFVMIGGRMSAVGLRFSSSAFTSFEAQSLNTASSGRLIIPQVANAGGFLTTITLVNKDAVPATVSLQFYRRVAPDGTAESWIPPMTNNQPLQNVMIPPGSSATWQTTGTGSVEQGWGEVLTNQQVSGFAVFLQRAPGRADQEAAVPVNAGPQQRFLLPFDNTQPFTTTMALANFSGGSPASIAVTIRDEENAELEPAAGIEFPALGHLAFALPERFPQTAGRRGTIEFQVRAGSVSAVGLRFAGEPFTSFKPQVIQ